jgi:hypothetical protein
MRSNLSLFLSSSVVERSAVNRLVVGSNPTWGDFINSAFFHFLIKNCMKGLALAVRS